TIEEYIEYIANLSVTIGGSDFITVTGDGTATNPYEVSITEGSDNSMLITNAKGELEWATIESIVKGNETVTTLTALSDGKYEYTSEDNTKTIIDIPASVVNNFESIVNEGPVTINNKEYTTIEEYIQDIANASVTIGGSDFITVTGDGTATNPYEVSITEGSDNSMLITNAAGELEWATIEDIVNNNITKGSLTVTGGIELTSGDGVDALLVSTQIGIADGGIITDKLADGAVTPGKIDGGNLGDILVTTDDGRKVEWMSKEDATTNELKLDGSKLTSTVNGVASEVTLTDANVTSTKGITGTGITVDGGAGATLKDVTLTLTPGAADQVMITKNGVATWVDQSEIVPETTNELESSGNTLTSTVNGEEATADIINSVANSLNDDNELVTTVNGVAGDGLDLTPAIQANQKTVTVVDGTNTTVTSNGAGTTGNNTEYKVNVSDAAIQAAVTLAGDVTGKVGETNLAAIQGTPVIANGTKTAGQALVFDGTNWVPGKPLVDATDVSNAKDLTAADYDADPTLDKSTIEVTNGTGATLVDASIRVKGESITTDHIQDGTVTPEDIADAGNNQVLVTDAEGKPVWKDQNKVAPQFFYMPAVIFDTSATGTATRDLYQEYVNQFTGGAVGTGNATYPISHGPAGTTPVQYAGGIIGSTGAPADIAVLGKGDLYYYVTYYDEAVFKNLSIDVDGKLTYTVKAGATPSSYMNIVFVIK
ncbi:hypothetical protein HX063_05550, partial [Myroides odoratimimus]|uniref:hypothetical protein n=1 Tax=Myroides odoratimimus TaxID=76832 RepID=UPI0025823643|nr:hypothetical protein [Myroides odoratimimus]